MWMTWSEKQKQKERKRGSRKPSALFSRFYFISSTSASVRFLSELAAKSSRSTLSTA